MEYAKEDRGAKRARRMAGGPCDDIADMVKCAKEDEVGDYLTASARLMQDYAAAGQSLEWHPSQVVAATRGDGVDIVFTVCERYKVPSETICSSVLVMDRFLERAATIDPTHPMYPEVARLAADAPLLSVACFLIMCKFRERVFPLLPDLVELWKGHCSVETIKNAEIAVLAAVDWNLRCTTALEVATKIMAGAPPRVRNHMARQVEFLVEVSYYSPPMMRFSSSSVAVAAIRYAAERLNLPEGSVSFIPQWLQSEPLGDEVLAALETCYPVVPGDDVPMDTAPADHDTQEHMDRAASAASTQEAASSQDVASEVPSCAMELEDALCEENGDEEDELLSPTNVDLCASFAECHQPGYHAKGGDVLGFSCSGMPGM